MSLSRQGSWASSIRLGIDASNIRGGGGLTHLVELLRSASPIEYGFSNVVVWASQATLAQIENRPWLQKRSSAVLEGHYLRRALWQRYRLGDLVRTNSCDLLFVPGGSFATNFRPVVTMSRNLLPFEWRELRRHGLSKTSLRLLLLRWSQSRSIRKADGTIFLTHYAKDKVLEEVGLPLGKTSVIRHGIARRFFQRPHTQRLLDEYSEQRPCRLVYVSIINTYKHQWHVAEAVAKLRAEGLPVTLDLVGPAYQSALRRLQSTLRSIDREGRFIRYLGVVSHAEVQNIYRQSDLAIFASSCETFGQILTEYMAAGLPIACSNRSAMPELLGDAGVYFDPEQPEDIARALRDLIVSPQLRTEKAQASYQKAQDFSWQRCASDTFAFLEIISRQHLKSSSATT